MTENENFTCFVEEIDHMTYVKLWKTPSSMANITKML